MFTLVLVAESENQAELQAALARYSSLAPQIVSVPKTDSLIAALAQIKTPMVVMSTAVTSSAADIASIIRAMLNAKSNGPLWTTVRVADQTLELGEVCIENIANIFMKSSFFPAACLYLDPQSIVGLQATDLRQLLAAAIVKALADGEVAQELVEAVVKVPSKAAQDFSLSNAQTSAVLQKAVESFNIEEMFPDYDWLNHSSESAASAFHMIAAAYIKLEDLDAAMQCLTMSDSLEDSPRSQALRAIIAASRGETLGAVAHLVSSLQEYEKRKKRDPKRCLVFTPTDTEQLNLALQSGLDALNKHDNAGAFGHFAAAVFNFDSFYSRLGLDKYSRPVS